MFKFIYYSCAILCFYLSIPLLAQTDPIFQTYAQQLETTNPISREQAVISIIKEIRKNNSFRFLLQQHLLIETKYTILEKIISFFIQNSVLQDLPFLLSFSKITFFDDLAIQSLKILHKQKPLYLKQKLNENLNLPEGKLLFFRYAFVNSSWTTIELHWFFSLWEEYNFSEYLLQLSQKKFTLYIDKVQINYNALLFPQKSIYDHYIKLFIEASIFRKIQSKTNLSFFLENCMLLSAHQTSALLVSLHNIHSLKLADILNHLDKPTIAIWITKQFIKDLLFIKTTSQKIKENITLTTFQYPTNTIISLLLSSNSTTVLLLLTRYYSILSKLQQQSLEQYCYITLREPYKTNLTSQILCFKLFINHVQNKSTNHILNLYFKKQLSSHKETLLITLFHDIIETDFCTINHCFQLLLQSSNKQYAIKTLIEAPNNIIFKNTTLLHKMYKTITDTFIHRLIYLRLEEVEQL